MSVAWRLVPQLSERSFSPLPSLQEAVGLNVQQFVDTQLAILRLYSPPSVALRRSSEGQQQAASESYQQAGQIDGSHLQHPQQPPSPLWDSDASMASPVSTDAGNAAGMAHSALGEV